MATIGLVGKIALRLNKKMSVEGLEPSTNGLKGHCSAIELHAHIQGICILTRS
jgi:hypothetical protein